MTSPLRSPNTMDTKDTNKSLWTDRTACALSTASASSI